MTSAYLEQPDLVKSSNVILHHRWKPTSFFQHLTEIAA